MAVFNLLILALDDKYSKFNIIQLGYEKTIRAILARMKTITFLSCETSPTNIDGLKDSLITSCNGENKSAQLGITLCVNNHWNCKDLDRAA